jgi:hypothetical protein
MEQEQAAVVLILVALFDTGSNHCPLPLNDASTPGVFALLQLTTPPIPLKAGLQDSNLSDLAAYKIRAGPQQEIHNGQANHDQDSSELLGGDRPFLRDQEKCAHND